MKNIIAIIIIFCLLGCGEMLKSIKQTRILTDSHKGESSASLKGAVDISYPEPTSITLTASGNSSPSVIVGGPKGSIRASKKEQKAADEAHSDSFSLDEFVESVPSWLWPVMIFSIIMLMFAYWWISKNTAAGKAADNLLAGGINLLGKAQRRISSELIDTRPDSDEHRALKRSLTRPTMISLN